MKSANPPRGFQLDSEWVEETDRRAAKRVGDFNRHSLPGVSD